jgi:hypothetical protein
MPIIAALILSELIAEAKELGSCAGFPFFNIGQTMPDFSVFGI